MQQPRRKSRGGPNGPPLDLHAFEAAYDALTLACNTCHRSMGFGFNQVQRPTSTPYANQFLARAQ